MLVGRDEQLASLQNLYGKLKSSIVVLYGRTGMGKTTLAREFMNGKDSFYYSVIPAAAEEARFFMSNAVYGPSVLNGYLSSYEDVFIGVTMGNNVKKVIVIDEFTHISKNDGDFLKAVFAMVKNQADYGRVMVILVSSSVSYIEGNRKKLFGDMEKEIVYMKLEELKFMDTMRFFASYAIEDCVRFYGITGGVPLYISKMSRKLSFEENVCRNILQAGAFLREEGHNNIREELRETALYNTILGCMASGMNKINDIYNYTGFGRDKISVYLKNLMERDLVEKVYSYDVSGKENIKKGSYRVKPGYLEFWYRYLYFNQTALTELAAADFYNEYIQFSLNDFMNEAFIRVCSEYMQLLEEHDGLAIKTVRKSRVFEKNVRIDIIREDKDGISMVGQCEFLDEPMQAETLYILNENIVQAGLRTAYIYLFAKSGFCEELKEISRQQENIVLVDIKDL